MGPARGAPEVALSGLEQGTGSLCAVRLSAAQRAELLRLARAALPGEACGLLLGSTRGGRVLVERIVGARNVAEQPLSRYRVDPLTQLEHERAADAGGPGVVGAWYSHPRTGSEPSAADLEQAAPSYVYVIVSLRDEDVRAWRLSGAASELSIEAG